MLRRKSQVKNFKVVLLMAVICLAMLGFASCEYSYYSSWANYKDYLVGDSNFSPQDLHSIDIDWINGKIKIIPADVDTVTVKEVGNRELQQNEKMRYLLTEGELSIKFAAPKLQLKDLDLEKTLQITVPNDKANKFKDIKINAVSTGVDIKNIRAANIDIESVSGDIDLQDNKVAFCDIDSVSGKISVIGCQMGGLSLESISQEIVVANSEITDLTAELTSGDLNFTPSVMPSVIEVDAISAKVYLTLPDSGFTLDFSTVSGEIENSFATTTQGNGKYIYGDGLAEIKVSTVSGDLFIKKL